MVTGNRNTLNSIKGITSVVKLTAAEKTALADRVLPANVLVVDSSNIVYLTDGVTAVKALNPLLASSNNYAYDKDVVHLTGNETIAGTKTFSTAIVGSVTGNAGSATKLATARTINGTSFNGTANITTANWGTARNISITDGTNTSTAVSVNGSANVSLNLPATIKATFVGNVTGNVTGNCSGSSGSCTGNAATATKATGNANGKELTNTIIKGLSISGKTITYTQIDGTTGTLTTQDTNTDTLMTQNVSTTNSKYPILLCPTADAAANQGAKTGIFGANALINPSTGEIISKSNGTGAFRVVGGNYGFFIRNDGSDTYFLLTASGDQYGSWTSARPLTISNSTGVCSINGNAATATNATNAAKLGNIASSGYVQTGKVNQTIDGTKTFSAAIASSVKTNTYIDGNKGVAIINSTAPAGYNMLYRIKSTNGVFTGGVYNQSYELHYTVDTTIAANTNAVTYTTTLMNEAGDATFAKNVTINVGLTVKGDANFANITASYITGLFK